MSINVSPINVTHILSQQNGRVQTKNMQVIALVIITTYYEDLNLLHSSAKIMQGQIIATLPEFKNIPKIIFFIHLL